MSKRNKAIAKVVLTVHYDLNDENTKSIKDRLVLAIERMALVGELSGDDAHDAIVDTWHIEVSVAEIS